MTEQNKGFSRFNFILGIAFVSVGLFQLGKIMGSAAYSDAFRFEQISLMQIGLICSGIFGFYLFVSNLKRLNMPQGSPNK